MTFALVTKTPRPNTRCWSEDLGTRREKKRASGLHEDTGARNVSCAEPPSVAGWLHVRLRRKADGIRESGLVVGSIVR